MKRILVDVDCVVADLMPTWLKLYNDEFEDTLKVDDIRSWGLHEYVKSECGSSIYSYLQLSHLYKYVKPIDGALSGVRWLRTHGYDVVFVTSGVHVGKAYWLQEHGFLLGDVDAVYASDLVFAHDKSIIRGDIMVDDNPKNLEKFAGLEILFKQPWNDQETRWFQADGWPDVIQYLARKYGGSL